MTEQQVDLGALLDAGDGAVVTLVAGKTRLAAHRAILVAGSPVLATKLARDTPEVSVGEVIVPDVEGPVLRQLVSYLYTHRAHQLSDMAPQLLAAADKYGISSLKNSCEQQVATQLSIENAAASAVLAVRHSCSSLKKATVAFVRAHTHEVMTTQGWAEVVRKWPEDVVEFTQQLAQPTADTSTAAVPADSRVRPTDSRTCPTAAAAPAARRAITASVRPLSLCRLTPASAATPVARTAVTVSSLQALTGREKSKRLLDAVERGRVEEVRLLLAAGADAGAREDYRFSTALHLAAQQGLLEAMRCLLDSEAEVDAKDSCEDTALHDAARKGHADVVRLLLASGADCNSSGQNGYTPLHWAADMGKVEAAIALLEAGAVRAVRNHKGETPLDLAVCANTFFHCQQLVQMLS